MDDDDDELLKARANKLASELERAHISGVVCETCCNAVGRPCLHHSLPSVACRLQRQLTPGAAWLTPTWSNDLVTPQKGACCTTSTMVVTSDDHM